MKTQVDAVSGVERKIMPLKGFRKGKAPMEMVKRLFRASVEGELAERLVKESLADVVKEKDLRVLSLPSVDHGKVTEGKDFVFSATVEVVPVVDPGDYKGIP